MKMLWGGILALLSMLLFGSLAGAQTVVDFAERPVDFADVGDLDFSATGPTGAPWKHDPSYGGLWFYGFEGPIDIDLNGHTLTAWGAGQVPCAPSVSGDMAGGVISVSTTCYWAGLVNVTLDGGGSPPPPDPDPEPITCDPRGFYFPGDFQPDGAVTTPLAGSEYSFDLCVNPGTNAAIAITCSGTNVYLGNAVLDSVEEDQGSFNNSHVMAALVNGGVLAVSAGGPGDGGNTVCGAISVVDGQWHTVLIRQEGLAVNVYVDDVLDITIPVTGSIAAPVGSTFGAERNRDQASFPPLTGYMDDIRVDGAPIKPVAPPTIGSGVTEL